MANKNELPQPPQLDTGLTPDELALKLHTWIELAIAYGGRRRRRWSRGSIFLRIFVLAVSVGATVTLGFAETDVVGKIGFGLSALVTVLAALEPFFNLRSRWIQAEAALAGWYDLKDDLELLIASHKKGKIPVGELQVIYREFREVWNRWSSDWISARAATQ